MQQKCPKCGMSMHFLHDKIWYCHKCKMTLTPNVGDLRRNGELADQLIEFTE